MTFHNSFKKPKPPIKHAEAAKLILFPITDVHERFSSFFFGAKKRPSGPLPPPPPEEWGSCLPAEKLFHKNTEVQHT